MHVAICDDNELDSSSLFRSIKQYAETNHIAIHITSFRSGEELLSSDLIITFDIVFLDIYMEGISGFEIAKTLRANYSLHIIFITSSKDHALEAFNVNAVHYLVKPVGYGAVKDALTRCQNRNKYNEVPPLEIKTGHNTVYLQPQIITYIESFNKLSVIHSNKGVYETYTTLSSLSPLLGKSMFIWPHRSYIVNMNYIHELRNNELILMDGTIITLSRRKRNELKNQYEQFVFKSVREGKI